MELMKISLNDMVNDINNKAKLLIVNEIENFVNKNCFEYLRFKENTLLNENNIIKSLCYSKKDGLTFEFHNIAYNADFEDKVINLPLELIEHITKLMVKSTKPYYKWAFKCENEPFEETMDCFDTEDDAYESMKKAALDRLSSLTDKSEFYDISNDNFLHFNLDFYHKEIILNGHGGKCIYKVFQIG